MPEGHYVYFTCPKTHLTMVREGMEPPATCEAPKATATPGYEPCGASPLEPYKPRGNE